MRSNSSGQKQPNGPSIYWKMLINLCAREVHERNARGTNMQLDQKEQQDIFYYILAYLSENPDAGDTFDGIVEWWLLDQRIKFETQNVSEAVAKLVSEGWIVEHEEPDSRIIYKVNRTMENAIRKMLSQVNRRSH